MGGEGRYKYNNIIIEMFKMGWAPFFYLFLKLVPAYLGFFSFKIVGEK